MVFACLEQLERLLGRALEVVDDVLLEEEPRVGFHRGRERRAGRVALARGPLREGFRGLRMLAQQDQRGKVELEVHVEAQGPGQEEGSLEQALRVRIPR